jgi:Fe-S cluster biogenesis protein NfuA
MNPRGFLNCMSNWKTPLETKENEMKELFDEIKELKNRFDLIKRFNVSGEIKAAMSDSLQEELKEVKNVMYDLIESIALPKFELPTEVINE